ncbi:glycoside hydrolase family 16 protein [Trametes versicolor FP-101664 SS1]|uniref:glycoside hydrolase family 16 protein n=1 Tax=Trametes versicolor (strain FP-101664) TaxID=717944 RepID=UPI00046216EA|nr:glycoside hydrolase family 16 protein [Trametes versicolor FP-101664 SS1]EIW55012.1 glycoside hydrolase family 16 protein [Trametes versicolor FP-101664 SS1]
MSFRLSAALVFLLASLSAVSAQQCNATSLCPTANPCCSEFGFCGTGSFCLGGCNPLASNTLTSCSPEPVCQNANHTFTDFSRILSNATYFDGNATKYDWVVNSGNIINSTAGELGMTLTQDNGGTRLSSTRYVHYGKITTRLKTGKWGGVVTAFITMSDIKDEIDWEFPGAQTTEGQSNYFWQGVVPAQTAGGIHGNLTDTFVNYHDYTIDWQQDTLTWLIDGNVVRTLKRSDATGSDGVSRYPSTPSRIELSIWPAGINTSAQGTIDWAGGLINWNDPDYVAAGHFYALVNSVSVECADTSSNPANAQSYVYGKNASAFTPAVDVTNQTTVTNGAPRAFGGVSGVWSMLAAGAAMALGAMLA